MKAALFLTGERAAMAALAAAFAAREPAARWCAYVGDEERDAVAAAAPGLELRRDKPAGGKAAFVRALRAERFDLVVVAWQGGARRRPLKFLALLVGARRVLAVDEDGRERAVALWRPWTWLGHCLRRGAAIRWSALGLAAAAGYRATVGLLLGAVLVAWRGRPGRAR